jgi:hypothetical protein
MIVNFSILSSYAFKNQSEDIAYICVYALLSLAIQVSIYILMKPRMELVIQILVIVLVTQVFNYDSVSSAACVMSVSLCILVE